MLGRSRELPFVCLFGLKYLPLIQNLQAVGRVPQKGTHFSGREMVLHVVVALPRLRSRGSSQLDGGAVLGGLA